MFLVVCKGKTYMGIRYKRRIIVQSRLDIFSGDLHIHTYTHNPKSQVNLHTYAFMQTFTHIEIGRHTNASYNHRDTFYIYKGKSKLHWSTRFFVQKK